jgi:protein involved in polysaccharide export with SLBB domain
MEIMKLFGRGFAGVGLLLAAFLMAGCETDQNYTFANDPLAQGAAPGGTSVGTSASRTMTATGESANLLANGDEITVSFSDIPSPPLPIVDTIKDDGTVTLILDQKFHAAGKTTGELQAEIHDHYVPKYFRYLTVSIATKDRFYYVGGEVKSPSRQVYSGRITVVKAIDTAGGFTDFARKGRVRVIRPTGQSFTVDYPAAIKHPEKDREIYPGDRVHVDKRPW